MDELICRTIHGRANEAEAEQLRLWRRASMRNERYYRDLVRLLRETAAADLAVVTPSAPKIIDLIDGPVRKGLGNRFTKPAASRFGRTYWLGGGLTAALVILAILLATPLGSEPSDAFTLGTGEIVTGVSETTTIKLGDGTVVRLAPESRLRITGEPGTREVWMDGRAYFAVARHDGQPFRVRTHAGEAVVLGTRFDLRARDDDVRLLVVDGSVELTAQGESVKVMPGQEARAGASLPPVRQDVDADRLKRELEWLGDFLVFEGTPLGQVADELSAHYGVPINVLDDELASETVKGMFKDETLENVLRVVCRAVSAHCSIQQSHVTISP